MRQESDTHDSPGSQRDREFGDEELRGLIPGRHSLTPRHPSREEDCERDRRGSGRRARG